MRIFFDMDSCITDWVGGACRTFNCGNPYLTTDKFLGCDNFAAALGISDDRLWSAINSVDWWANLEPLADGFEVLRFAEDLVGKENICLLTSPTQNKKDDGVASNAAAGKILWINRHLPDYRSRFLIGYPKEFAASPNTILIDDSDNKCKKFTQKGGFHILFPRLWNSGYQIESYGADHVKRHLKWLYDMWYSRINYT